MQQQTVNNMVKFVSVEDGMDAGMIIENGQLNDEGMDLVYEAIESDDVLELEVQESTVAMLNQAYQEELESMVNMVAKENLIATYQKKVGASTLDHLETIAFGTTDEHVETEAPAEEEVDTQAVITIREEEELSRLDDYGIAQGLMLSTPSGGDMMIEDVFVGTEDTSVKVTMMDGETRFVDAEYLVRQVEAAEAIDREDEIYEKDREIRQQFQEKEREAQQLQDDAKIRNNEMFQRLRRFRRNGGEAPSSHNTPANERRGLGRKQGGNQ